MPLEGGITNRNFKVEMGGQEYVIRLHGKDTELLGISREAERIANGAAAELGIAPAVTASFDGGIVTRYERCASLDPRGVAARAAEIGRALRAFHDSGAELPVTFWVPELLRRYAALVRERSAELPAEFLRAEELAGRIARALPLREARPCHNDLLAGNLIVSNEDGRTMIVDWEYAGMGLPSFDLGNLSVNNELTDAEEQELLGAYLGRTPQLGDTAAVKLARVLSDAREGAWGIMQAQLSDLEFDFAGYARLHFGRMEQAAGGPAFAGWLAAVGQCDGTPSAGGGQEG
ncbi:MAG: phosphotransferase [Solirubrobacteraceae bacterium]